MKIVPLSSIEIRKRQRTELSGPLLNELRESILQRGLLHPPVYWFDSIVDRWVLTVGERRTRAIQSIAKDKLTFHCSDQEIPSGYIPITPLGDYLNEIGRFEAELDENIIREPLSWQDKAQALSDLHTMRTTVNVQHSIRDTANELAARGVLKTSGEEFSTRGLEHSIRKSRVIAAHLSNPKIAKARNEKEALALIYKSEEEKATGALLRRLHTNLPKKLDLEVRHGDLLKILPSMDGGTIDLILADPPYGLGAGAAGFRARTVHHHNYPDTMADAQAVALAILAEGMRLTKPRANLFIFCDIDLFDWLKRTSANLGWTPFRRPLIWQKSESEGLAPWGGSGPRITTEFIFYATKGQRGMTASPVDWFNVKRVSRSERLHAAEKPVELLSRMIELTTLPGELVLDPCCGSGSTLVACRETKRLGIGIEVDVDYYNTALSNVHGGQIVNAGT